MEHDVLGVTEEAVLPDALYLVHLVSHVCHLLATHMQHISNTLATVSTLYPTAVICERFRQGGKESASTRKHLDCYYRLH